MLDSATEQARLIRIVEQIAATQARIVAQEALLDELRKGGYPSKLAERTLFAFEDALATLRETQRLVERAIADLQHGKQPAPLDRGRAA